MQVDHVPIRMKDWVDRIIDRDRVAHAYLFVGKKGAGKYATALYFAQALLCRQKINNQPCRECADCLRIEHNNHPDVHALPLGESASIKIDQIRELQKNMAYKGMESDYKVYVIPGADTMTPQAANSLLKFLEEPTPGTRIFLLAQNRQHMLSTILSRCQDIHFSSPSPAQIAQLISLDYDPTLIRLACHISADLEEASALCISDWFAELKNIVIKLTKELVQSPSTSFFLIQDDWMKVAKERGQTDVGLDLMLYWYRDLLHMHIQEEQIPIFNEDAQHLAAQQSKWTTGQLSEGMAYILEAKRKLHDHVHPQLVMEQLVLRMYDAVLQR